MKFFQVFVFTMLIFCTTLEGKPGFIEKVVTKSIEVPIIVGTDIVFATVKLSFKLLFIMLRLPLNVVFDVAYHIGEKGYKEFTPKVIKQAFEDAYNDYKVKKLYAKKQWGDKVKRAKLYKR